MRCDLTTSEGKTEKTAMASRADVLRMLVDGVFQYLARTLDEDVVARESIEALRHSKINGESFLELTNDELRELLPVLGERKGC